MVLFKVKFLDNSPDLEIDLLPSQTCRYLMAEIRQIRSTSTESKLLRLVCSGKQLHADEVLEEAVGKVLHCIITDIPAGTSAAAGIRDRSQSGQHHSHVQPDHQRGVLHPAARSSPLPPDLLDQVGPWNVMAGALGFLLGGMAVFIYFNPQTVDPVMVLKAAVLTGCTVVLYIAHGYLLGNPGAARTASVNSDTM
ncbi:hypothetical protein CEUSTIGMA_g5601.t1 [Chlamydomonas eustigma]|uniref:DSC E3 ubiquitin ligase complex subunit 3 ubiquitin-like domain-containing protein n=1 Tax=Chlamydomonas eustigma TaxID=1157962 RepID=A0A250X5G3_9CHLO|nr:hypothetical protein CEUSTIGMA_g5601.t1 [Chlamydomonas eustigma]|eukprot:GAX78159.1 hypothetical protein CEUSTIGMA_g5601.t1 [Chlamydomonas eustigma]